MEVKINVREKDRKKERKGGREREGEWAITMMNENDCLRMKKTINKEKKIKEPQVENKIK